MGVTLGSYKLLLYIVAIFLAESENNNKKNITLYHELLHTQLLKRELI